MTDEQRARLEDFFTAHIGEGWQTKQFLYLDGMQIVEVLWPMNDVFRAHHAQIGSIAYSKGFEAEADQALALYVQGGSWTASNPSAGVWRVLMERHIQSLSVALANHVQGNTKVMLVPQALPVAKRKFAAMLYLQWAMELPFPVENRATYQWPGAPVPGNLQRH